MCNGGQNERKALEGIIRNRRERIQSGELIDVTRFAYRIADRQMTVMTRKAWNAYVRCWFEEEDERGRLDIEESRLHVILSELSRGLCTRPVDPVCYDFFVPLSDDPIRLTVGVEDAGSAIPVLVIGHADK